MYGVHTRGCGNKLIENFRLINPFAYTVVHNIIILYIIGGVWLYKPHLPAYHLYTKYTRTMPRPLPFFSKRERIPSQAHAGGGGKSGSGGDGGGSQKKKKKCIHFIRVCAHSFIFR